MIMSFKPSKVLTVLSVKQDFKAVGFIVVERLSDFVDGLLVRQLSVHETEKKREAVTGGRMLQALHLLLGYLWHNSHGNAI